LDPTQNHVGPTNEDSHVPLGRLLVDAGLLAAEDLERALAEQLATGKPLGRVLVDSGYVAPTSVAMALADQHGGLLKTEYGYATGRRPADRELEPLRLVSGGEQPAAVETTAEREGGELAHRLRAEEAKRVEALGAERDELRGQVTAVQAELVQVSAEREALRTQVASVQAELAQATAERDELHGQVQAAEVKLAEARSVFADLRDTAQSDAQRIAELEALVAGLQQPAAAPPPAAHVLFVPLPDGYVVRDADGPPPSAGAAVEVDGLAFRVLRTGPAPFPGTAGVCAYLEPR
jgi:hypothetical protein